MTRVCVATAGHLSTCPRMVKVADALAEVGYDVHVVSTQTTDWAAAADRRLYQSRRWSWEAIDLRRDGAPRRHYWTGVRHRLARIVGGHVDPDTLPGRFVRAAFSRAGAELTRAVARSGARVVVGGTSGALAAVHDAAEACGAPYVLDLEDYHLAEREDAGAALHHRLARRLLAAVLPDAALVSTASREMAQAYGRTFGVEPLVVHNVWPRPTAAPPAIPDDGPLRFYWFSQTIGPGRGLDEALCAIGAADIDAEFVVRGRADHAWASALSRRATAVAPRLRLVIAPPVAPDDIPATCEGADIGLATELTLIENHALAASNKLFMYLTTGLALLATPTPAQRSVLQELQGHVAWMDPAAPADVAPLLRRWHTDRARLRAARQASWEAACRRWHWEHPDERGRFLAAFARLAG